MAKARSTYKYVIEKAKDIVSRGVLADREYLDFYVVPHGIKNGSGDIFGMWDMIVRDRWNQCYYFVQISSDEKRSIKEHGLDKLRNYVFSGDWTVRYFLVVYKKRRGRYEFKMKEAVSTGERIIFSQVDIS